MIAAARQRRIRQPLQVVSLSAERSRRKRNLRAAGLRCYTVTVDESALEETLRRARNFAEAELADRKLIEAELSEVLALWFERWTRLGHG
jgi:hypothetical protein